MKNSKSREWDEIRDIEDVKAKLAEIRQRVEVVLDHAMNHDPINSEPSFDQIYIEAHGIMQELDQFDKKLTAIWSDKYSEASGKKNPKILRFKRAG